jgi:diguanylate cyclase (GGDEF)-like protein
MKPERVLAWLIAGNDPPPAPALFSAADLPFQLERAYEPAPEALAARLAAEPFEVLCVEEAHPFTRTRRLLQLTDTLPMRPVVIVVAAGIDVPTTVDLMESGVFSVLSDVGATGKIRATVSRALENRRAFQKILDMSRSLQRSRTSLERKTVALSAERVKLKRKVSEVSVMRRVAEWLGSAKSLEEGLAEVLPPLAEFVDAAHGVFLVTPEKGRWVAAGGEGDAVVASAFPRSAQRIRRAGRVAIGPDGGWLDPAEELPDGAVSGIAFPVRVKRRFLGYGVFWGGRVPDPTPGAMRLLEAVGVQVGAFCENIVLREEVATERDRLARAKDELNFLFQFASSLNEDPDLDGVFEWLCRQLGRFVPYSSIEFLSLLGNPEFRVCGLAGITGHGGRISESFARQWRRQLPGGTGPAAPGVLVKEFPYGDASAGKASPIPRWIAPLSFGDKVLGFLAVHAASGSPAEPARERVLKSVTAQLSLFLHNFAEREKVRVMASNDGLTGLFNYRSFQDRFDREFEWFLRRGRNLALLMIDLDNFKQINDTFGHQVGDQVLLEVAAILQQNLRKTDYAFRYGGDEFVVLMPDTGVSHAEVFAERIRRSVKSRVHGVPPYEFRLSLSIGIADCTVISSREKEELLNRADGALYQAKAHGRDRIQVAQPPAAGAPPREVRDAH